MAVVGLVIVAAWGVRSSGGAALAAGHPVPAAGGHGVLGASPRWRRGAPTSDNAWHDAFGRDAVEWSPPHMSPVIFAAPPASPWAHWRVVDLNAAALRAAAGALLLANAEAPVSSSRTGVPQFIRDPLPADHAGRRCPWPPMYRARGPAAPWPTPGGHGYRRAAAVELPRRWRHWWRSTLTAACGASAWRPTTVDARKTAVRLRLPYWPPPPAWGASAPSSPAPIPTRWRSSRRAGDCISTSVWPSGRRAGRGRAVCRRGGADQAVAPWPPARVRTLTTTRVSRRA